ncbi:MAG TPA: hypothetical protein VGD17_03305 [Chitinophagaceae bacterium]
MSTHLLKNLLLVFALGACASPSRVNKETVKSDPVDNSAQPVIPVDQLPKSMMDLPQTQYGGFVLSPGFYEAEFKTYCLQPGTPDPRPRDAYLQSPVTGYRKDIIESVLINSREHPQMDQKNIQLLLWSVVSGSDFNKLSSSVRSDAMRLLTSKQIFELNGGVIGLVKTVSNTTGILNANRDMKRLFEMSTSSYENFERLAVLNEPSQIKRTGVKADKWYKQKENYFVRYFPVSYKKVRIQVYVPDSLMDAEGKVNGEHVVFDPTGQEAIPAFTNAQRLGIGAPVADIVRVIIQVSKDANNKKRTPKEERKDLPKSKQGPSY